MSWVAYGIGVGGGSITPPLLASDGNMWFAAGSVTSGSGYIAALIVTPTGGVTSVNATLVDGAEPLSNLVTDGTNVYVLL